LRSVIYQRNLKAEDDDQKYKTETYEYDRPASAAISELAPANHFYAEGRKLEIDQVSLQVSTIETWRFCHECSYLELEESLKPRSSCPQCGSALWADEGQRRNMLRMRQVLSTQSEQESRSYDESDEREPEFYQKNMFVVKEDADNRLLESELEGRFIEALRRTADGGPVRTITHQVVNGKEGFYLRCELGNYLIEPQVELGIAQGVAVPSRADFVLYPERPHGGEP
jgi:hypothetical protein